MTGTVNISGGEKFKEFLEKVKKQKARVDVGFFPEAKYTDGTQVAEVAIWQEFGTKTKDNKQIIPPRPFLHSTYEENKSKWLKILENSVKKQGKNIDVKKALEKVGFVAQNDVREKIDWWAKEGVPRNSKITIEGTLPDKDGNKFIKGKGFDSPLIETGHMRDSVSFKVTIK